MTKECIFKNVDEVLDEYYDYLVEMEPLWILTDDDYLLRLSDYIVTIPELGILFRHGELHRNDTDDKSLESDSWEFVSEATAIYKENDKNANNILLYTSASEIYAIDMYMKENGFEDKDINELRCIVEFEE